MKCEEVKIGAMYLFRFSVQIGTESQLQDCKENDNSIVTVVSYEVDDYDYDGLFLVRNSCGFEFVAYGVELLEAMITNY